MTRRIRIAAAIAAFAAVMSVGLTSPADAAPQYTRPVPCC